MEFQYLTFTLDETIYATEVGSVQEVLEYKPPQVLPCSNPVIAGLIRSRGKSIAVIKMRRKFDLPEKDISVNSKIIVFEIHDSKKIGTSYIGAIVDSVQAVIPINSQEIESPPTVVKNEQASKMIKGVAERDNKFVIILDIEKLFSNEELTSILSFSDIKEDDEK